MNWSRQRNGLVRGLLLSLTLIAMAACAAAQQKKPSAPAPSTSATKPLIAPKPAEAKPHEAPKTESKPAEAPKHEAKPATGATSGATHPGSTAEGKTGTSTTPHTSGVRTGGTPNPKTNGTASAAKPVGERVYAEPVVVARPGGGKSVTTASGHTTSFNPEGKRISLETKGGSKANFDHH
ncbi:MAG TPA: hypothetical protein VJ324_11575, partial [Candidatus Acidoferrum sp.]|nr:hypothetical protein [Candidatus Acidoferrum sp.]